MRHIPKQTITDTNDLLRYSIMRLEGVERITDGTAQVTVKDVITDLSKIVSMLVRELDDHAFEQGLENALDKQPTYAGMEGG